MADRLLLRPTLPGYVHGIVDVDPPTVQCDGCGKTATGRTLALAILRSDITFRPPLFDARLCGACAEVKTDG